MADRKIVNIDMAFYVDDADEGSAKIEAIFKAVNEAIACEHGTSCRVMHMNGDVL